MQSEIVAHQPESLRLQSARLLYLDWLRVFAILFVFVYHSSRFFNSEDWHVKNPTTFAIIMVLYEFLVRRLDVLRVLFGIKPLKRAVPAPAVPAGAMPGQV